MASAQAHNDLRTRRRGTASPPAIRSEAAERYYARIPFLYAGTQLSRGQVFTLANARNDDKLVRMRYMLLLEERHQTHQCPECGAEFVDLGGRDAHARSSCPARPRRRDGDGTPYDQDAQADA